MKTYGQHKVLFGSNFPLLLLEKCVQQVKELGLEPEIEKSFLETNAQRVFRL